jgi:hypothetical protein
MPLLSLHPEPWASHIDLLSASQALEVAIHAADPVAAATAVSSAATQVANAYGYLRDAGYATQAGYLAEALAQLQRLAADTRGQSPQSLPHWQQAGLYPFQGVIAWLDSQVMALH